MHLTEHSIKMRRAVHTMFGLGLLDVSTADGGTWVIGVMVWQSARRCLSELTSLVVLSALISTAKFPAAVYFAFQ